MKCSTCQEQNPFGSNFCLGCGAALTPSCVSCSIDLPVGSRFCNKCGSPVTAQFPEQARSASPRSYTPAHLAEKILTSRAALEGERKQVTVLFCDLVGSTALAARLGPDAMHGVLDRFFDLALDEVHRYEGTINQFLGDGFMALFGAPVAHEDHARRAVLAAFAVRRALADRQGEIAGADGGRIDVRIGLNTGVVVVGKIGDNLRMDYTAIGDTTNLAARLQQLAPPSEIWLGERTHSLVERHVECEALGQRTVKGKVEPVEVYRLVLGQAVAERRLDRRPISSVMVGRDSELATLTACVERLVTGQGGIVSVVGEAGLGKSRLMAEASRKAAELRVLWLEGRALSFGRTLSYWPFLEILRRWAGITEQDTEAESHRKLRLEVEALLPDEVPDVLPYITTLLGLPVSEELEYRVKYLDGQAMGRQVFRSTRRLFERLAATRPIVLVFEDLHWVDASSAELIAHMFPLTATVPLLLCGVGRPERHSAAARLYDVPRETYGDRYTGIMLAPLSARTSAVLLDNLLGNSPASVRLREVILARTEGNPLFVEEVVRALVTADTLVWDSVVGQWRLVGDGDQVTIPDTLQGVISARIDRLDEEIKQTLKLASVIGRNFFYRVLGGIAEASQTLETQLDELEQLQLIREKRRVPELEYFFKHALVQEATYESILVERRRQLHREVGQCIERLFADRLDEFSGVLAYHYARAEDWPKAHEYLLKAGDQAGRVAADTEALAHYREALSAYARTFGDRWDMLDRARLERKMGEALSRQGELEAAGEYLDRALRRLGSALPSSRSGLRWGLAMQLLRQAGHHLVPWLFLRSRAPDLAAIERSRIYEVLGWIDYFGNQERFIHGTLAHLNWAEEAALPVGVVRGAAACGIICDVLGLHRLAERYHRRALSFGDRLEDPTAVSLAHLCMGFHEHFVGRWDSALNHFHRSAQLSSGAGDLRGAGAALSRTFHIYIHRGQIAPARALAQEILRIGEGGGDSQVRAWGLLACGVVASITGSTETTVAHFSEALRIYTAMRSYSDIAETHGYLGQCYLRQGDLDQALGELDQAERLIQLHRVRGHGVGLPRNAIAEAALAAAERATGQERRVTLRRARGASDAALRQAKIDRSWLPSAMRNRGVYHWLEGEHPAAERWWQRSLAVGEELQAVYDVGLTYLQMGQHMGTLDHIKAAVAIFGDIGASVDLQAAKQTTAN